MPGSRHSAIATAQGHVWTMGHDDSKGGGGHGSIPMLVSGQLGRAGDSAPGRVLGELEVRVLFFMDGAPVCFLMDGAPALARG